ncbi:MAG TPA: hypothetical protein VFN57_17905 [Thermomicrobiaceae bacterium]|nr:hypothetical protein [Thermomicrobiaceae bacterium]
MARHGHPATPATPATPTATPRPTVRATQLTRSGCCGVFAWVDASRLLAYDTPTSAQSGSWLFDTSGGTPTRVSPEFGPPSPSGIVPISDPAAGVTRLIRLDGSTVSQIQNGGDPTWVSDDGKRVAWLQPLPGTTPSSLLNRPVRLWVSNIDGGDARAVIDMLAAEVAWLPDNRRVLVAARALDTTSPGVWLIDTATGAHQVLAAATFVQAVRLSPDGKWFSYLVTFSGNPARDGVWVGEIDSAVRHHVAGSAFIRWGPDDQTLWRLDFGVGSSDDQLVSVNLATGAVGRPIDLGGRVLNDDWEVSPNGRSVAYWRESDRNVMLVTPLP